MINISIVNEQQEQLLGYQSKFLNYHKGRTIVLHEVNEFGNDKASSSYQILSITHAVTFVNELIQEGALIVVRPIDK